MGATEVTWGGALEPAQDQGAQSDKSLFNKVKGLLNHLKRYIVHRS